MLFNVLSEPFIKGLGWSCSISTRYFNKGLELQDIKTKNIFYILMGSHKEKVPAWLVTAAYTAQIALAVVAIFGYLYTVRPIYQKERLAEQVAEYEGIIEVQTPKVAKLEQQLVTLERDRGNLKSELDGLEKRLSTAHAEKRKIEKQTQFMTYQYYLPDGKPAKTREQVHRVKEIGAKSSFSGEVGAICRLFIEDRVVFQRSRYSFENKMDESSSFPFTERELEVWLDQGTRYPLTKALECVKKEADKLLAKYSDDLRRYKLLTPLKKEMLRKAKEAGSAAWKPPFEPRDIIAEFARNNDVLKAELKEEYKKVEVDYGGWEKVWGEARRIIAKQNYEVSRVNAENKYRASLVDVSYKYREKANEFRKEINMEAKRIVKDATKKTVP